LRVGAMAPGAHRRLNDDSPSTPLVRSRRKVVSPMSRPARAERCFSSHSPYSSTLDHAFAAGDACLRGGALEPGACDSTEKVIGKPRLN